MLAVMTCATCDIYRRALFTMILGARERLRRRRLAMPQLEFQVGG